MQLQIKNARIIDPQSDYHGRNVDIVAEEGKISTIKDSKSNAAASVTADGATIWKGDAGHGLTVSPGWVDLFADYCEPGYEHKETITSGLAAAASGGFTDVFIVPNTQPEISSKSVVQFVLQRAAGNIVNLHPLGCATQQAAGKELAEMLDMRHAGAIAFTDGWKPVQNSGLMLKVLEYVNAFEGTVIQLPIEHAISAGGLMNESVVSTQLGMPGIPGIAESIILHRDIELLRYTRSRLHVTGISTAASVAQIRKAKQEGLRITCSATPYHLALTENMLTSYNSAYKVMPPLRGEEDRLALLHGLADGTIDCIATHHRPQEWDAKMKEFEYAADGMALQEVAFSVLWHACNPFMGIDRLVEAMSILPRDIFGLPAQKINVGEACNMTIFTTHDPHTSSLKNKRSAAFNDPFKTQEWNGRVIGIANKGTAKFNSIP